MAHSDSFRLVIWSKLDISNNENENGNRDDNVNNTAPSTLYFPLESFSVFGFVDNTGFRTNAPGRDTRRCLGYSEDVQRAFYSGYFDGHGLKVQAITLPSGLFGSIFLFLLE